MKLDLLIKNGTVIDPAAGTCRKEDIGAFEGKIVRAPREAECANVVDAEGCYVTPGLIDSHVHVFEGCGVSSVNPDITFIPNGVTTGIDAGTAGVSTYKLFSRTTMRTAVSTIKAYIHPSPTGLAAIKYFQEPMDPRLFDHKAIAECVNAHRDEIVAIKMRISRNTVGAYGLDPLKAAVEIGEEVGLPVAVHTTDPAADVGEVLNVLRRGDVYSHCYHGRGYTLVNDDGRLKTCVREARGRGIIFDTADGLSHFAFRVARAAFEEGFFPDIISTDEIDRSLYKTPVYSMPYILSKYLALGMELPDIVKASTLTPARVYGLESGTLNDGAAADIAVFRIKEKNVNFLDSLGDVFPGSRLLIPQLTVKNGIIVYRQVDFTS